jgi:3-phytase
MIKYWSYIFLFDQYFFNPIKMNILDTSCRPTKSLNIGTDKHEDGALYAFDLKGKVVKVYNNLTRPNNVDVAYGFPYNDGLVDIAVVTERLKQRVRIFKLPDLEPIDQGNLMVFDGDTNRAPTNLSKEMPQDPGW